MSESISSSVKLFADNWLANRNVNSPLDANQLQENLDQFGSWVNVRQMALNLHKYSVMHISMKQDTLSIKCIINGLCPWSYVSWCIRELLGVIERPH